MKIIKSLHQIHTTVAALKRRGRTIGFVPTMGALHHGHLSLVDYSRRDNDITIMSIFVNPTQFGPNEDYARYPREEKQDILLAKNSKVDIMFFPSVEIMYPSGYLTYIETKGLSDTLCGKSRPDHFTGVTTVIGKLLNLTLPNRLYLGQKDAQQAVIIRKMIHDLNFPCKVKVCPIVREINGLAMSSRNKYLSKKDFYEASILYKSLKDAKHKILQKKQHAVLIKRDIKRMIQKHSRGKVEYVECVDAETLEPVKDFNNKTLIALAVKFGRTRLIDNIIVKKT